MKNTIRNIVYSVRVNGEVSQSFASLRDARSYVKTFAAQTAGAQVPSLIEVVKVSTVETIVNTYVPQQVTTFVSAEPTEDTFDTGIQEL